MIQRATRERCRFADYSSVNDLNLKQSSTVRSLAFIDRRLRIPITSDLVNIARNLHMQSFANLSLKCSLFRAKRLPVLSSDLTDWLKT